MLALCALSRPKITIIIIYSKSQGMNSAECQEMLDPEILDPRHRAFSEPQFCFFLVEKHCFSFCETFHFSMNLPTKKTLPSGEAQPTAVSDIQERRLK